MVNPLCVHYYVFNDSADGKAVQKKMSQFTEDPELYTNLTDHVFHQILTSSNKELEKVSISIIA